MHATMTAFPDVLVITPSAPSQNASAVPVLRVIPLLGSRLERVPDTYFLSIHDCRRQSHAVGFDSASARDSWCELLQRALRDAQSLISAPYEATFGWPTFESHQQACEAPLDGARAW